MTWPETRFDTLFAAPTRNGIYKPKEFHGTGCRMVNMGELFGFDFIGAQPMERVQLTDAELATSGLVAGDLLFGRRSLVEAGAGKCSLVVDATDPLSFESSIIRVRMDSVRANPRFYYYWFRSPLGRGRIRSIVSGTNVKGIRSSDLKALDVAAPPRATQDRVVDVLTAYDDLIENNRRRITLLEEAARQLYQEWFVRLRFPGSAHTPIVDGLPAGWTKTTAREAMDVLSGGTPKTTVADFWDGDIPFYTPKDAADCCYVLDTDRHLTELGLASCNSRLYPTDTLFITARGTVGKLNLAGCPMAMSQSCYALVGRRPVSQIFLFCALQDAIEHFKQHAGGAVFDAIVVDTFKLIPFTVPAPIVVRQFDDVVTPIFRLVANLFEQNRQLRVGRDLLLPRLMSGEVAA